MRLFKMKDVDAGAFIEREGRRPGKDERAAWAFRVDHRAGSEEVFIPTCVAYRDAVAMVQVECYRRGLDAHAIALLA